jgi:predicted N-acyltransferase
MEVSTSIADFTAAELDDLGDVLFGRPFLSFVEAEHAGRAEPHYFHLRDENGLLAFAPGYIYRKPVPFTFRLEDFVTAGALLNPDSRYLVLYAPIRLRSRVFARTGEPRRTFLRAVTGWAAEQGLTAVVLPFVLGSDTDLREDLSASGFHSAFYEGDFFLPVRGGDLDDFLPTLGAGPRKQFRNDINRLRRSDTTVGEIDDLGPLADDLAAQHNALMDRYHRPEPEFDATSFRRFGALVPNRKVVIAREQGEAVGFAISAYGHQVFHLLRYGRRPDADDHARIYSNLVYVESVRMALATGCRRVHFGKASHRAKVLRGCHFEEGIVYALMIDEARDRSLAELFPRLDRNNREVFDQKCRGLA